MNREKFLKELTRELGNFPAETRDEIAADFNEHFDAALASGASEEEICNGIGSPQSIARQYIDGFNEEAAERRPSAKSGAAKPAAREERRNSYAFEAAAVKEIRAAIKAGDVKIVTSSDGKVHVRVDGGSDYSRHVVELDDHGELRITEERRGFLLGWEFGVRQRVYEIGLPGAVGGYADIHTGAGNVNAENAAFSLLKVKSGAGNVNISDVRGELDLHTGAGNVTVKGDEFNSPVKADTGAGEVKLAAEAINAETSLRTGAGTVKLKAAFAAADITLRSGCGDVKAQIGAESRLRVTARSGMGGTKIDFPSDQGARYVLDAQTGLGSAKVTTL